MSGHVYFAACGKYVKIGFTSAPVAKRIASLPGKCRTPADFDPADTVWLLDSIPGCVMRDERRLHDLFAAHRAAGEWHYMSPAFLSQLSELRYVTYAEELANLRRVRADLRRRGTPAYSNPAIKITRPIGIRTPQQRVADSG
jgi:hypothetical protein